MNFKAVSFALLHLFKGTVVVILRDLPPTVPLRCHISNPSRLMIKITDVLFPNMYLFSEKVLSREYRYL